MPAIRSEQNATLICERIIEGHTLRQIARELGCTAGAISIWVSQDDDFAKRYANAKALQADLQAEEILEIADDSTNDWMQRELDSGEVVEVPNHEHINRSRLRVDSRKWLMAKMLPKKYGDRVMTEVTGKDGGPIAMSIEARQEAAQRILDATFGPISAAAVDGSNSR